ncbi:hypothetical protein BSBH6_02934 [Bacillus subtilis]|nr:hypothetical protein BSBH6_02934 [Bacillus subtilis]RPK23900.1 hypothetical protein BH5_02931 [Bacillus subtilis]
MFIVSNEKLTIKMKKVRKTAENDKTCRDTKNARVGDGA